MPPPTRAVPVIYAWVTQSAGYRSSFKVALKEAGADCSIVRFLFPSRVIDEMASPGHVQDVDANANANTHDDPATDTASSSGPSLEIDVRPTTRRPALLLD